MESTTAEPMMIRSSRTKSTMGSKAQLEDQIPNRVSNQTSSKLHGLHKLQSFVLVYILNEPNTLDNQGLTILGHEKRPIKIFKKTLSTVRA